MAERCKCGVFMRRVETREDGRVHWECSRRECGNVRVTDAEDTDG